MLQDRCLYYVALPSVVSYLLLNYKNDEVPYAHGLLYDSGQEQLHLAHTVLYTTDKCTSVCVTAAVGTHVSHSA